MALGDKLVRENLNFGVSFHTEDLVMTWMVFGVFASLAFVSQVFAAGYSAQESAEASARAGRMAHRGGSYAYEGVGYSTRSADDAIRNCCYWGRRTPVEIGVARGRNGWFACVRYR